MSPAPRSRPPDLRTCAVRVVRALTDAGYVAYFAGGCVRDRLLDLEPKDYDVATDARPEQIRAIFPRAHSVGEAFGVMLVRLEGHMIEVATFRTDGEYVDGRHPETVTYGDAEHDAQRRNFTINGLFEDPLRGAIVDFVGGRNDLARREIRAIGDPGARLDEDRLRMLRAVRFAARFGFSIEPDTAEAIRAAAGALRGVSRERIGHEVRMMLVDPNRAVAIWELQYLGLDEAVLDEPPCLAAPVRIGRLPAESDVPTGLAAWWLDRDREGAASVDESVARWSAALVLSNAEREAMRATLEAHRLLRTKWSSLGVAAQKRLASSDTFDAAQILLRTEDPQAFVDVRRRIMHLAESGLSPEPLLTGDDLIAGGMTPGPVFGRLLEAVYDAQLEGAISSRAEALALARGLLESEGPHLADEAG